MAASFTPVRGVPDEASGLRWQSAVLSKGRSGWWSVSRFHLIRYKQRPVSPALHAEAAGVTAAQDGRSRSLRNYEREDSFLSRLPVRTSASALKGGLRGEKDAPTTLLAPQDQLQVVTWAAEQESG